MGNDTAAARAIRASTITDAADYWRKRVEVERAQPTSSSFSITESLARLGEKEKALGLLEKSVTGRSSMALCLKVHPNLDPLRSEPRFKAILQRVRLLNYPNVCNFSDTPSAAHSTLPIPEPQRIAASRRRTA